MMLMTFQKEIEEQAKKRVRLRINDNHSTMLSVKWESDCTKVSMHRIFLDAPKNIMDALACHIQQENSNVAPQVKAYIEERLKHLDYSKTVNRNKIYTQGDVYDLNAFFHKINDEYFNNKIDLLITWYGKKGFRNRSRVTFGLYHQPLRLIKIHRMMDSFCFPDYFVEYVIFHEMLHHVCPSYYDSKGKHCVHSEEFKRLERQFYWYDKATKWLKENISNFFIN
jgi:hypothetical protein